MEAQPNLSNQSSEDAAKLSPMVQLLQAMHLVKMQVGALEKDKANPFLKVNYVTLGQIYSQVTEAMAEVGLYPHSFLSQGSVWTEVYHLGGEKVTSVFPIPEGNKADIQKLGAAITYGTRYNLFCLLGLPQGESDTDGETRHTKSHAAPTVHTEAHDFNPF